MMPLPGLGLSDCKEMIGNDVERTVTWAKADLRQIGGKRYDAIGLRRNNRAGDKTGDPQQDVGWLDFRRKRTLGRAVRGVTGLRRRHKDMSQFKEAVAGLRL